jgi:hypothetical protein
MFHGESLLEKCVMDIRSGDWTKYIEHDNSLNYQNLKCLFISNVKFDSMMHFIAERFLNFKPHIDYNPDVLSTEVMKSIILDWNNRIVEEIRLGILKLLNNVDSIQEIINARNEVLSLTDTMDKSEWNSVQMDIFSKEYSLWIEILQKCFLERSFTLINQSWSYLSQNIELSLRKRIKTWIDCGDGTFGGFSYLWEHDNSFNIDDSFSGSREVAPELSDLLSILDLPFEKIECHIQNVKQWSNIPPNIILTNFETDQMNRYIIYLFVILNNIGRESSLLSEKNDSFMKSTVENISEFLYNLVKSHNLKEHVGILAILGHFVSHVIMKFSSIDKLSSNSDSTRFETLVSLQKNFYEIWTERVCVKMGATLESFINDTATWSCHDEIGTAIEKRLFGSNSAGPWEKIKGADSLTAIPSNPSYFIVQILHQVCRNIELGGGFKMDENLVIEPLRQLIMRKFSETASLFLHSHKNLGKWSLMQLYFDVGFFYTVISLKGSHQFEQDLKRIISTQMGEFDTRNQIDNQVSNAFIRMRYRFHLLQKESDLTDTSKSRSILDETHNLATTLPVCKMIPSISLAGISDANGTSDSIDYIVENESNYALLIQDSSNEEEFSLAKRINNRIPNLPNRESIRSIASDVASNATPALQSLSSTIQSRLGSLGQYF